MAFHNHIPGMAFRHLDKRIYQSIGENKVYTVQYFKDILVEISYCYQLLILQGHHCWGEGIQNMCRHHQARTSA